jgi:hypothetical protein
MFRTPNSWLQQLGCGPPMLGGLSPLSCTYFLFLHFIFFKEGNKENVLGKKGKVFTKLGKIGLNYFFKNIWTSKN